MTELMPSLCNNCISRNQCGKDDVKMCVSYIKEVKIKCDDCKFQEDCVDYGWQGCRKFTHNQRKPMTNEEYLRSCSFEELAGAIYEWYSLGFTRGKNGKKLNSVTEIVGWLKEIHKE